MPSIKKTLLTATFLILLVIGAVYYKPFLSEKTDSKALKASMISVLNTLVEKATSVTPNLKIENILLEKSGQIYKAKIYVKNEGKKLINENLRLHADSNGITHLVKNTSKGFSLSTGKTYLIPNYEINFDDRYNSGEITLQMGVRDKDDKTPANNIYKINIFELPAKIQNFKIVKVSENHDYRISFGADDNFLKENTWKIFGSNSPALDKVDREYAEFIQNKEIFHYGKIKNSKNILSNYKWEELNLNIEGNSFTIPSSFKYVYLKAVNNTNAYTAFSDVISLNTEKSQELTRSEYAKYFIESVGEAPILNETLPYEDIPEDNENKPYISALYNLGLSENNSLNFNPEKMMTRAEALKMVLDYYDFDLTEVKSQETHFKDVNLNHDLHPYAEALYLNNQNFGEYFYPDLPVTEGFLKYLIHAHQKTN